MYIHFTSLICLLLGGFETKLKQLLLGGFLKLVMLVIIVFIIIINFLININLVFFQKEDTILINII